MGRTFVLKPKKAFGTRQRWGRWLALLLIVTSLAVAATVVVRQFIPASVSSPDWPMYLHDYFRDGTGTDTTISPSNASQLALHWSFKTGKPIASAPVNVGGVIYVGSWDGYEYALNATTGAQLWKTFLGQTIAPCYPQLAGVSSAANINNGVLYVRGGDSNFYALDPNTGAILWRVFVGDHTKGWYNWSSPLIYNGYAYVGTASMGDCPLIPGQLLQISLRTHQIVNSYNTVPKGQVGGGIWTSPSIDPATNTIFVTIGNLTPTAAIVALDATTLAVKASWWVPESDAAAADGDPDFGTSPILFTDTGGDQLLGAINKNGIGYIFNRNNLAAGPVWQKQIAQGGTCDECGDGSVSSAAFGNNTIFMAGGNTVINGKGYMGSVNALDPTTGNYLWHHSTPDFVIPALAYSNGLVLDGAGRTLEVLNASNGTRLWSYTTGGTIYAEPTVAKGQILAGSTDGNIYALALLHPSHPLMIPTVLEAGPARVLAALNPLDLKQYQGQAGTSPGAV
jgi:outer membrane protein assembly factor BamB